MKKTVKILSLIITVVMLVSVCVAPAAAFSYDVKYYRDVPKNAWYYDEVGFAISNELMQGVGYEFFRPNDKVTREQFVTILMRLDGKVWRFDTSKQYTTAFTDVKTGAWYADGVRWAEELAVTDGVSSDKFGIGNTITREEAATMIARYADVRGITFPSVANPPKSFKDAGKISGWAASAAELMRVSGIINGKDGALFDPKANATRAEAAAIFGRLYTNMHLDFNTLLDPDSAAHITFTSYDLVQGTGYVTRTYKITSNAEIKAVAAYLSKGTATEKTVTEAPTGPIVDSMTVVFKDGTDRNFNMSVSALTINGFKRYTFKDGYLQKYYDLMTVEK